MYFISASDIYKREDVKKSKKVDTSVEPYSHKMKDMRSLLVLCTRVKTY